MTHAFPSLDHLSDQDLLGEVRRLARRERQATAHLIASLAELDTRRLYLGEGCSSLFTYCTQVLHLSEHAAYHRIEAARAGRRFPAILELLADGSVTLTAIGLLARHLTPDNHHELLDAARHRSKREVEHLIARLQPRPPVPTAIRRLPEPKPPEAATTPPADDAGLLATPASRPLFAAAPAKPAAVVSPLAPERYKVQFTVGAETYEKLRRAQDLLRHTVPDGDPAAIFDRARRCCWRNWTRRNTRLRRGRSRDDRLRAVRGISPRRSDAPSGRATRGGAHSWGRPAGARSASFSSSITSCRSRQAERRRSITFLSGAVDTIFTRRRSTSGHGCCGRRALAICAQLGPDRVGGHQWKSKSGLMRIESTLSGVASTTRHYPRNSRNVTIPVTATLVL